MNKQRSVPFFMWALPLSFFTYQFVLRLWPSLMMQQIMQQFSIDATAFGILASIYYYGYAGMQIPIAIALDRYPVRYIIFFCAVLCSMGILLFSFTDSWSLALCARFLVGVGSAVGFLGTSKVISQWFPKSQYARMVGFTFTIGLLGAIYGGKPLSFSIDVLGWQRIVWVLASVSFAIGCFTLIKLKDSRETSSSEESLKIRDFGKLLTMPTIWLLGLANLLMVGSLEGFADVWGVNYLMTAYHFTKGDAAELTSFIFIGMLFGGPILAFLSKKIGVFPMIAVCGVGMAFAFFYLILSAGYTSWYGLAFLFSLVGILCCYQVLVFAAGLDFIRIELLGVTVAFLNCINMLGGSFFHTAIGYTMDFFWAGVETGGVRQYTVECYNHALMVIPMCSLIGAGIVLNIARTRRNKKGMV